MQNRRLRHLTGISLRNLIAPTNTTAVPAISLPDDNPPDHNPPDDNPPDDNPSEDDHPDDNPHTSRPRTRRRASTLHSAHRRPNVFFSLHLPDQPDPIYISETIPQSMNPDFIELDLSPWGPQITRSAVVTVRVFAEFGEGCWRCLLDTPVELGSLTYLGRHLESWPHALPENCAVFYMSDGAYAEVPAVGEDESAEGAEVDGAVPTASYDTLMKICNNETCILDAQNTTGVLTEKLNSHLTAQASVRELLSLTSTTASRLRTLQTHLTTARRRVAILRRRRDTLQTTNQTLTHTLATSHSNLASRRTHLSESVPLLDRAHTALDSTREALTHTRRAHLHTLAAIFPIAPTHTGYTILTHPIPLSADDAAPPDPAAAALGYVAQYLHQASYYLYTPLRYPVHPCGSRSTVRDAVSIIQGGRVFPLYTRGTVGYRFEYGVFLLGKDVEQLLGAAGVRVVEVRELGGNMGCLPEAWGGSGGVARVREGRVVVETGGRVVEV